MTSGRLYGYGMGELSESRYKYAGTQKMRLESGEDTLAVACITYRSSLCCHGRIHFPFV